MMKMCFCLFSSLFWPFFKRARIHFSFASRLFLRAFREWQKLLSSYSSPSCCCYFWYENKFIYFDTNCSFNSLAFSSDTHRHTHTKAESKFFTFIAESFAVAVLLSKENALCWLSTYEQAIQQIQYILVAARSFASQHKFPSCNKFPFSCCLPLLNSFAFFVSASINYFQSIVFLPSGLAAHKMQSNKSEKEDCKVILRKSLSGGRLVRQWALNLDRKFS